MYEFKTKNCCLSKEPTFDEIKSKVSDSIKKYWFCSKKNNNEEIEFINYNCLFDYSKYISNDFKSFAKYSAYISFLYYNWESIFSGEIGLFYPLFFKEIKYAEVNGVSCVYISVLLYSLLKESFNNIEDLKFVQGFYLYETDSPLVNFIKMLKLQTGLHSFISYKSLVIDCTAVKQQECLFNFDIPFIYGLIPRKFYLYGYEETTDIIDEYIDVFREVNGFDSAKEWITAHKEFIDKQLNDIDYFI